MKHRKKMLLGISLIALAAAQGAFAQANDPGFSISLNGDSVAGDSRVRSEARAADVALSNNDVQITYDGLGAAARLDLEIEGPDRAFRTGDRVTFVSALNYPAYVDRGEVRIIDLDAVGGARAILILPVRPNGSVTATVPDGENLVALHRVYDSAGRFDETLPVSLSQVVGEDGIDGVEEGRDRTARRRIPVHGGAVTVFGRGVSPGARVTALGEPVATDPSGGFVLQRILPAGTYPVAVEIAGGGRTLDLVRDVDIPRSEWFGVGVVDLTFGYRQETGGDWETFDRGRLGFYIEGTTANGTQVTASADTREEELRDLFRRLGDRDPRSLILRVDPDDLYPTYGDDSEIEDRTPTSGRVFLRIERDGNSLQWGDFRAGLPHDLYVRNDRTLYGLHIHGETADQVTAAEPRLQGTIYAAQPDQLPQRDVFRAAGGSIYFLEKQDVMAGTETVLIQRRNPGTGRILETQTLVRGRDYEVNYIQGIIQLDGPLLSGGFGDIITDGADAPETLLVVQYEYTPSASDVDGYAFGGRVEGWIGERLRFGVSAMEDQTGIDDQRVIGADVLYRWSEESFILAEIAESDGPGFGSTFSVDGGLIFDTTPGTAGSGSAARIEAQAALGDLGFGIDGVVSAYAERQTVGFSTLDREVTAATGDKEFWGVYADFAPREGLRVKLAYDSYGTDSGERDRTGTAEVSIALSERLDLSLALEHRDENNSTDTGRRTDAGARLDYSATDVLDLSVFGQATLDESGLRRNDRLGFGAAYEVGKGWRLEGEVSDGDQGAGGRVLARYEDDTGTSRYIGWELEPERELDGITLEGSDRGRWVVGGQQRLGERTTMFGENTYDVFGRHRALTTAYGLTFDPSAALSTTFAIDYGAVDGSPGNDFDRRAVTLGARYQTGDLTASGRIELRRDEGLRSGSIIDTDTTLLNFSTSYKIDETQRLLFSAEYAETDTDDSAILDGDYTNVVLGYALRPIEDDRLNVLARYRYFHDLYGQRVDSVDEDGPRQKSHVLSLDASYDMNPQWTLGGKLGYRMSETSASEGAPFIDNDAWLGALNLRYHVVKDWDVLVEYRQFETVQAGTSDTGILVAAYRHVGDNLKLGIGMNYGSFSDDLTDLVQDDKGIFLNLVAKY